MAVEMTRGPSLSAGTMPFSNVSAKVISMLDSCFPCQAVPQPGALDMTLTD